MEELSGNFKKKGYLNHYLYQGFKSVLCTNQNAANYDISSTILFYNYFNEIYDIKDKKSITLNTEYLKTDSTVLSKPPTEWPVWQFSCVRKLRNYYSFIRIHGEYFLIKYTLHGVEIARKKVEYSNVKNNFPIVGVARDRFLILNYSTREVKEVMFD